MYQKVSIASWCRPFDWLPALIAQMLNQPAFLIVPSGFSTISVSLRGRSGDGALGDGGPQRPCRGHQRRDGTP
jgi:hypothetical protein